MSSQKFRDLSIGIFFCGALICAAFFVHDYHATGLLGSKVSAELAGTAVQIRTDTSNLEQQGSKVLTEASKLIAAENTQSAEQLNMIHTEQKRLNELFTNLVMITADYKRDTAPKINQVVDELLAVVGNTGVTGSLANAVAVNSKGIQDVLATTTKTIGAIGPAIDQVKTVAVNAAGVIGVPGTTQGLAGTIITLNAAGMNVGAVAANAAAVIGKPGDTGTVGRIVSNVDLVVNNATHPEKLPFWKMVLDRFLLPEIPDLIHTAFSRWFRPQVDVNILNLPAQSPAQPSAVPK
jgi:hypothetical protein